MVVGPATRHRKIELPLETDNIMKTGCSGLVNGITAHQYMLLKRYNSSSSCIKYSPNYTTTGLTFYLIISALTTTMKVRETTGFGYEVCICILIQMGQIETTCQVRETLLFGYVSVECFGGVELVTQLLRSQHAPSQTLTRAFNYGPTALCFQVLQDRLSLALVEFSIFQDGTTCEYVPSFLIYVYI